ncbi:MAG: hypothetical protein K2M08_03165 [Anaeroplasmataceae bacterium]|nr:hypothetical protein [Anaeroplasmataceae bacterium]
MSLIFTIVVTILNLVVSIVQWITIERKIKLQYMMISSAMKKLSKKKKTTCSRQANR